MKEEGVGSRTILDGLDTEQELLDARSNLVMAARNEIVASMELRRAVGTLTVDTLGLRVSPTIPKSTIAACATSGGASPSPTSDLSRPHPTAFSVRPARLWPGSCRPTPRPCVRL